MTARADFQAFLVNEHLGDNQSDIDAGFTFKGEFSSALIFEINQKPMDSSGFVQYQVSHVDELSHEILVNGKALPAVDVFRTGHGETGLMTHTDLIPSSFLKRGQNTIQFQRRGGDNFLIHHVIVHWRELDPS